MIILEFIFFGFVSSSSLDSHITFGVKLAQTLQYKLSDPRFLNTDPLPQHPDIKYIARSPCCNTHIARDMRLRLPNYFAAGCADLSVLSVI